MAQGKSTLADDVKKTAKNLKKKKKEEEKKKKPSKKATKAASKQTSTEAAKHKNGNVVQSTKTAKASRMTSHEAAQHLNNISLNYGVSPSTMTNRESVGHYNSWLAEKTAKQESKTNKKTNPSGTAYAPVKGLTYRNSPTYNRDNSADYYLKGFGLGSQGYLNDLLNRRQMLIDEYGGQSRTPKYLTRGVSVNAGQKGESTGLSKKIEDSFDQNAKDFQKNYNYEVTDWQNDKRSQNLLGKASMTGGRFAVDLAIMLAPTPFGKVSGLAKGGKIVKKAVDVATNAFRNPALLASNILTFEGSRYDEAKQSGASTKEAANAARLYAIPQAYLQTLGGAEAVFGKLFKTGVGNLGKQVAMAAGKGALSEGVEEAGQSVWETKSRGFYGGDTTVTTEDIIDAAILGAMFGAIGGGVGGLVQGSLNAPKKETQESQADAVIEEVRQVAAEARNDIQTAVDNNLITPEEAATANARIDKDVAKAEVISAHDKGDYDTAGQMLSTFFNEGTINTDEVNELNSIINQKAKETEQPVTETEVNPTKEEINPVIENPVNETVNPVIETQAVDEEVNPVQETTPQEEPVDDGTSVDEIPSSDEPPEITIRPTDEDGNLVRGFADSSAEKAMDMGAAPVVEGIDSAIDNNEPTVTRGVVSDENAQNFVAQNAEGKTIEERANQFIRDSNNAKSYRSTGNGVVGLKELVTEGIDIYVDAVNAGDVQTAMDMMAANSVLATEIARGLQAYSQLKRMTPAGRVSHSVAQMAITAKKNTGVDSKVLHDEVEASVKQSIPNAVEDFANNEPVTEQKQATKKQEKNIKKATKGTSLTEKVKDRRKTDANTTNKDVYGLSDVKKIIREAIKSNAIDIKEICKDGNVYTATGKILEYAMNKLDYELSSDQIIFLTDAIATDLNTRLANYRAAKLNKLKEKISNGKTGISKSAIKIIDKLIEYNSIGALDDPDIKESIYTYIGVPALTRADTEKMLDLETVAGNLENGVTDTVNSSYLSEKQNATLTEAVRKYGAEHVANVLHRMAQTIAINKAKSNLGQKLRQWQITAMLLNVKTFLRNVVPNVAMSAVNAVGDIGSAYIDKQIAKQTGFRTKDTNIINNAKSFGKAFKGGIDKSVLDYKMGVDTSSGNQGDLQKNNNFSNDTKFGRTVNKATDIVRLELQIGDRPFEEAYRTAALNAMTRLNNVDEPTDVMKDLAEAESLERTFKDDNTFTRAFQSIVETLNSIFTGNKSRSFGLGSVIVPFVRTPVNLTKLLWYYTPVTGTVQIAIDTAKYKSAKKNSVDGKVSEEQLRAQYKLVSDSSKLIGGAVLTAMIMALKEIGKDDDLVEIYGATEEEGDEESDTLYKKETHGFQPYSIRIGNKYFNYGNIQPLGSIIGFAVELSDGVDRTDFGTDMASGVFDAMANSFNQISDQSVLKGIYDLFKNYGDENSIIDGVLTTALSMPQQFIPALIQQLGRVIDPYKRNTNSDTILGKATNKTINAIPGLSMTLPAQNSVATGEPLERYDGGILSDIFNSFANPVTTTTRKDSDVVTEAERLKSLGFNGTIVNQTYSIDYNGKKYTLTPEEQEDWVGYIGKNYSNAMKEAINTTEYKAMTDSEKAKFASSLIDYYTNLKRNEYLNNKGAGVSLDKTDKEIEKYVAEGKLTAEEYFLAKASISDTDMSDDEKRNAVLDMEFLSPAGKVAVFESSGLLNSKKEEMKTGLIEYGISNEDFCEIYTQKLINEHDDSSNFNARLYDFLSYIDKKYPGADNEAKKEYLQKAIFPVDFMGNTKYVDFSGDLDKAFLSLRGTYLKEVWYSGKWGTTPAKDLGIPVAEFAQYVSYATDGASKKADKAAKIDNIKGISSSLKSAILAATGAKPNVSWSNNGTVSTDTVLGKTKTKEEAVVPEYTTSEYMTDEEKQKRKNTALIPSMTKVYSPMVGGYEVTSNFGSRTDPISGGNENHQGVDIAPRGGSSNPPATSVKSGKVVAVNSLGKSYGNNITIETVDGYRISYSHLDSVNGNLKDGTEVSAGQQIGVVGETGRAKGSHVHIEVTDPNGNKINPLDYINFNDTLLQGSADENYEALKSWQVANKNSSSSSSSGSSGSSSRSSGSSSSGTLSSRVRSRGTSYYGGYGYGGYNKYGY